MKALEDIVREMLDAHVGGQTFFDNLDEAVQCELFVSKILDLVHTEVIVASGGFGRFLSDYFISHETKLQLIVLPGGLRNGVPPYFPVNCDQVHSVQHFCAVTDEIPLSTEVSFVDDSFYSGRTRDAVAAFIKDTFDVGIKHTYVIYDGSKAKDPNVTSLYRYYDHHGG